MRKVVYWVHTSVDGFIAGPNGEFDWPAMGPELSAYSDTLHERADTFLYGRVVWELMASYWPTADQISDHPHNLSFAKVWRRMPKVVFSTTLTELSWNARVATDVEQEVRALKAQPGKDMVLTGGARLAGALAEHDLIDEYQIVVHPVVLGGGKQVFPFAERFDLWLADTRTFDGRSVLLSYHR
ncbi:dihydrofolate reductase family protein [Actinophytocola algeriensis]|uniref:Dihydrofolate reductase n=1 Tax=Actinophytocola algeriensis TaxID=1768010 RepID=A0A7W7Q626_9PSEU|nr:dihydrofolate reductase family protein [Actinophytocola algeriensis]MBB4907488.1 dihydrofolate reductase [Actinophytocola algeriensis]MBE1479518.1 dihydrofolate reductase [Actinophytocola algeriensis]